MEFQCSRHHDVENHTIFDHSHSSNKRAPGFITFPLNWLHSSKFERAIIFFHTRLHHHQKAMPLPWLGWRGLVDLRGFHELIAEFLVSFKIPVSLLQKSSLHTNLLQNFLWVQNSWALQLPSQWGLGRRPNWHVLRLRYLSHTCCDRIKPWPVDKGPLLLPTRWSSTWTSWKKPLWSLARTIDMNHAWDPKSSFISEVHGLASSLFAHENLDSSLDRFRTFR